MTSAEQLNGCWVGKGVRGGAGGCAPLPPPYEYATYCPHLAKSGLRTYLAYPPPPLQPWTLPRLDFDEAVAPGALTLGVHPAAATASSPTTTGASEAVNVKEVEVEDLSQYIGVLIITCTQHTHACMLAHMHTRMHACAHARTHAHTHTCTHTRSHTHVHLLAHVQQ